MRRGFKVLAACSAAVLAGILTLPARADDLDAQKQYLVGQINSYTTTINPAVLDAQKNYLLGQIDSYVAKAKADQAAHEAEYFQQRVNNIKMDARNYADYLQQRIKVVAETTRVKKEVLNNYTNLSKTSAQYAALIPAATADYQKALYEETYAQAVANAAKMFVNGPFIDAYAKAAVNTYRGPQDAGSFVMKSIGVPVVY
ncbi:MAG: hypothetical protein K6G83_16670 [Lachnospiraceae bacterium]|nr:hypothetical protein [Lachnospiraceae bacterium]